MPACKYGEWFPLYECRIHLWLGDTDLAFKEALEIVRKKSSEFWAWSLLAVILIAQGKHDDAFTCLVKSATCPGEEKFRFSVRFDLARRLVERKMYPEAKFEADRGREGIEFYGHDVPDDIAALEGIPEYAAAPTLKDNKALYRKYLSSANELLLGNLPWFEAILGNKFTKKKSPEDKNRKAFLQYLHKNAIGKVLSCSVSARALNDLTETEEGSPIKVKGEWDGDRFKVFQASARLNGASWDLIKPESAIVENVNSSKHCVYCVFPDMNGVVIPFDRLKGIKAEPGDILDIRRIQRRT